MRDDLPNQIHMVLCAIVPLSITIFLHNVSALPFGLAAGAGIITGFVTMFAITPLTFKIYSAIARAKYGKVPRDTVVHRTDAGCSSLIFVALMLMLYPIFISAKQKLDATLNRQSPTIQNKK